MKKLFKLNSYLMRGGTSKGLFFKTSDLPSDLQLRNKILLNAIGSPDPFKKQIDGLGAATSSTSKIVLISKSLNPKKYDVDYTFGHVAINKPYIDYSGNCGNLTAAVGVFALEEKLVDPTKIVKNGLTSVSVWQQNLQKPLEILVPTDGDGMPEVMGDFKIAGVHNPGPEILINFLEVGGGKNLEIFPTNNPIDVIKLEEKSFIEATLINAGNPTIFVMASALGLTGKELPNELDKDRTLMETLEKIRCLGAVKMGMAVSIAEVKEKLLATPKISIVSPAQDYITTSGKTIKKEEIDICARIISMGKAHHAYTGTGTIAAAVAGAVQNTIVRTCKDKGKDCGKNNNNQNLKNKSQNQEEVVRIGHPAGITEVGANVQFKNQSYVGLSATFKRSARVLMKGQIYVPIYNQ